MICRRAIDIEGGPACDRDYMGLAHFELLGVLKLKGKLCYRTENSLPKLTPCGADGNFGTKISRFVAFGVFDRSVMSPSSSTFTLSRRPVRLYHFCSAGILVSVLGVKGTSGPGPFHPEICDGVNASNRRFVQRHRRWISFPASHYRSFGPDTRKATRKSLYPLSQILRTPRQ